MFREKHTFPVPRRGAVVRYAVHVLENPGQKAGLNNGFLCLGFLGSESFAACWIPSI